MLTTIFIALYEHQSIRLVHQYSHHLLEYTSNFELKFNVYTICVLI